MPLYKATTSSSLESAVADVLTAETAVSNTAFVDLATVGPSVTITTGANALVVVEADMWNDQANGIAYMGFVVSGATTLAADVTRAAKREGQFAAYPGRTAITVSLTGLTPGVNTFTAKYAGERGGGGGFNTAYKSRRIAVIDQGS